MARLNSLRYVLGAALAGLWRNRTMSVGAIVTTAIMLITLATFLAINDTLNQMVAAGRIVEDSESGSGPGRKAITYQLKATGN